MATEEKAERLTPRIDMRDKEYSRHKAAGDARLLPLPPIGILPVYNLLLDSGFQVDTIAYIEGYGIDALVTYAVIETVERPDEGGQYYEGKDPLRAILESANRSGIIAPEQSKKVPTDSRFGISKQDVYKYIIPTLIDGVPFLRRAMDYASNKFGDQFRVPTVKEFQYAGTRYPHFGSARSWELLHEEGWLLSLFKNVRIGGHRDQGGVQAIRDSNHPKPLPAPGSIGFRLQFSAGSQHVPEWQPEGF